MSENPREEAERLRTKHLLAELEARGAQSRYAERLRRPQGAAQALYSIEQEFLAEMAASLGRAEERLLRALVEVEALGAALDEGPRGDARTAGRDALLARYHASRDEAERRLQALRIQREACGFHRNELLDELYPIPPRRD